jgi:hypothetical protein
MKWQRLLEVESVEKSVSDFQTVFQEVNKQHHSAAVENKGFLGGGGADPEFVEKRRN